MDCSTANGTEAAPKPRSYRIVAGVRQRETPHSAHRYQRPAAVRRDWLENGNINERLTA